MSDTTTAACPWCDGIGTDHLLDTCPLKGNEGHPLTGPECGIWYCDPVTGMPYPCKCGWRERQADATAART